MEHSEQPSVELIDANAVIQKLKQNGTFDQLQTQALQKLKDHADLNAFTENYVRKSDAAKSGRINQIYGELKGRVAEEALPKALESYWEILSNPEYGISQLLEDALVEAMCDLEELKAR